MQFLRYALVGATSNLIGYLAYLLLTWGGLSPRLTASLLYVLVAGLGYWWNRRFTFASRETVSVTGWRYAIAHALGLLLNVALLTVFAEGLGYAHEVVQLGSMIVVAIFLFVIFRSYVFRGMVPQPGQA